jgi:KDO2-lipid IV(A) lauroyltransferase
LVEYYIKKLGLEVLGCFCGMIWIFNQLGRLPLSLLHRMGTVFGWVTYLSSKSYASRMRENLRNGLVFIKGKDGFSEIEFNKVLHASVSEVGKSAMELPWVWKRPLEEAVAGIKHCQGWEHIEAAQGKGKGVLMMTPHFGCFELISLYIAARQPMTSMYRPPKWDFLDILMHEGRERGQTKLAATDMGGVRQLLKALKRGETVGVLPDQVPGNGEGEWSSFFGQPAYTMTLIGRLIQSSGAGMVMCSCKRLPRGEGFELNIVPLVIDDSASISQQINASMELVIATCPEQYLWSYNRYKVPSGALPPEKVMEVK